MERGGQVFFQKDLFYRVSCFAEILILWEELFENVIICVNFVRVNLTNLEITNLFNRK